MSWSSFVDYYIMRELGQTDAIIRNYKLDHPMAHDNYNYVYSATRRMGMTVRKGNKEFAIDEVVARLRSYGATEVNRATVRFHLNAWYVWDRIKTGELKQWQLQAVSPTLI